MVIISFCYTFVVIGCMDFSLVEVSGGCCLVTVRRLLLVLASHRRARAPGVGYGRVSEESRKSMRDGAAL